jgi:ABC-type enterobactin transport system permease subunit
MDPADTATAYEGARARRTLRLSAGLLACLVLLLPAVLASLAIGNQPIAPGTVLHDLVCNDGSDDALIIRGLRLPRTALGLAVGAALGLAGATVSAILGALISGLMLADSTAFNDFRFWSVGALAGRPVSVLWQTGGFMLVGALITLPLAGSLNALALGEETGRSLGVRPGRTGMLSLLAVTLLCGGAIAAAGPIGFVGLAVPHAARQFTGPDHRWLLPYTMVLAPVLLLAADVVGRVIAPPGEVDVGISRNPLGSPDIVGFDTGAATGALVVITLIHGGPAQTALGAMLGGVATAAAVYVLAMRRGVQGYRLILVGVGVGADAMLSSVNGFLLTRASVNDAQSASLWLIGSLDGRDWDYVVPETAVLVVLPPAAWWLTRGLAVLELGDDLGRGLLNGLVVDDPVAATLVTLAIAAAAGLAGPLATGEIVQALVSGRGRSAAIVPAVELLVAVLIGAAATRVTGAWLAQLVLPGVADLREQVLAAAVALPVDVAVVGISGSGKSTLAGLVAGLYQPRSGTITLDGVAASNDRVALIAQQPHVFSGTVADNLRLAASAASDAQLNEALARSGAATWVRALPQGIETLVGAGGRPLTTGQAQHLALARLLLLDPDFVVLDEATAEGGSETARILDEAARIAVDGRGALLIAHRLSQAAAADHIVVMRDGRVIERGTHEELVAGGGAYALLWEAWSRH